jgi:hypothetical protein
VSGWLAQRLSDELVLELPLTGSLYLLVPLLTLHALASRDAAQLWLALPLATFAASVAAALYARRIAQTGLVHRLRFAGYAGVGLLLTLLPAALAHPLVVFACGTWLALSTLLLIGLNPEASGERRRFEASTARRSLPWLLAYLIGLASYPVWSDAAHVSARQEALALLEAVAAFTVLGYVLAEVWSRSPRSARVIVASVTVIGLSASLAFEQLRELPGSLLARAVRAAALTLGTCAGAVLHRAQVSVARAIAKRRPALDPRASVRPIG